jgi:hypothetical protein
MPPEQQSVPPREAVRGRPLPGQEQPRPHEYLCKRKERQVSRRPAARSRYSPRAGKHTRSPHGCSSQSCIGATRSGRRSVLLVLCENERRPARELTSRFTKTDESVLAGSEQTPTAPLDETQQQPAVRRTPWLHRQERAGPGPEADDPDLRNRVEARAQPHPRAPRSPPRAALSLAHERFAEKQASGSRPRPVLVARAIAQKQS